MSLVVTSDGTEADVKRGAELLEEGLLALPEVSLVSLDGVRGYEIAIEVSDQTLHEYSLTLGQIATAIRANSLNLSSGEIRTESGDLLIRTNQKRNWGEEFKDVVIRALPDGSVLRVTMCDDKDGFVRGQSPNNEYNGETRSFRTRVQVGDEVSSIRGRDSECASFIVLLEYSRGNTL